MAEELVLNEALFAQLMQISPTTNLNCIGGGQHTLHNITRIDTNGYVYCANCQQIADTVEYV